MCVKVQEISLFIIISLLPLVCVAQSKQPDNPAAKNVESESNNTHKQVAALFEAGQAAHERGELEKAIENYMAALKLDPSLWQIELQLGLAHLSLNRPSDARKAISHTIEQLTQYVDSPEQRQALTRAQVALGEVALAEAKLDEAEKAFRRALEFNPKVARAHAGLAEIKLGNNQHSEAIAEARAALEAGDQRASTYALLGEALIMARQYEEALIVINELLKREPRNVAALRYRAEIFLVRKDYNGATIDLRAAIAIAPRLQDQLRLAELYISKKQYDAAITIYQQILKDEPTSKEARTGLAITLLESGKAGDAIIQLESLLKIEPKNATIRAQLAELYLPKQPEKALEQYAAATKLTPNNLSYQIGVGAALVKLRRFQEAVPVLQHVLTENPKDEVAYFAHTNLATALFELDEFANAAREFVWILNHQHEQKRAAVTLYFLGICFDKLGDYEQALKAYEQFLSLANADNQLEIDKVKLRLPSLQRQIKDGKGIRKKK
jgi:tetratricopeptide (TPR) repeat protein